MKIALISSLVLLYIVIGVIKLKFFDWNKDGDWLAMLGDERNRKCPAMCVFLLLICIWLMWPITTVFRNLSLAGMFFRMQWRYL